GEQRLNLLQGRVRRDSTGLGRRWEQLALDAADQHAAPRAPTLGEVTGEPGEELGRRGDDRVGRCVALADLTRIDVDVHERSRALELRREPVGPEVAEAGSDREHDVDAILEITPRR